MSCTKYHSLHFQGENTTRPSRPSGVTALTVLELVSAIGGLGGGWGFLFDPTGRSMGMEAVGGGVLAGNSLPIGGVSIPLPLPLSIFVGAFLFLLGLAGVLMGWGLWTGKAWAWRITLFLAVLQVIWFMAQIYWVGLAVIQELWIALQLVIVYYLYRPRIKAYFGK